MSYKCGVGEAPLFCVMGARTIARPFCSTVSCPSNGARRFYVFTLRARRFSLYRRRTVSRRVRGAGRAWRSGGSIRGRRDRFLGRGRSVAEGALFRLRGGTGRVF